MRKVPSDTVSSAFSSVVITRSQNGIPFLPGLALLSLGVVLLVAPGLILAALALCLLILGSLLCFIAYKFIMLRKQINVLAKNMESSLYGASFKVSRPDIDVTDAENGKIVYH